MVVVGGLLVAAVASSALYRLVLGGPTPALITWLVIGGIAGIILGASSGRRYGLVEGLLAGITGATLFAALFMKVRPEGGAVTFSRAVVAGIGAVAFALLARFLPTNEGPDVA